MAVRPYLRDFTVVRDLHAHLTSGYRYHADFQCVFSGVGTPRVIGSVMWNTERKLLPNSTRAETKITEANFTVFGAGLGWNKLEELPGNEDAWVFFSNTVIQFKKRFVLNVPISPLLSEVPILKELEVTNSWPCEAEGFYDITTEKSEFQVKVL